MLDKKISEKILMSIMTDLGPEISGENWLVKV